ncbi:MAG TPA: hypothetical protein VJ654_09280 [Noviherbaspirillum sp.]|nr:hypothetical protein [Noviherbaspirillum sp.]
MSPIFGKLNPCLAGLAFIAASVVLGAPAIAENAGKQPDIEARYQSERAACETGKSGQDRATCLREAAAAREAARQGQLNDPPGSYEKNALARCELLPEADRDLCRRRTRNEGVTQGSVPGGGIYREYREVTLPEVQPPAKATPGTTAPGSSPANKTATPPPAR